MVPAPYSVGAGEIVPALFSVVAGGIVTASSLAVAGGNQLASLSAGVLVPSSDPSSA